MRIVIDLQGAQAASRLRGIGRYSLEFALALAKNRRQHEVIIALNGLFPESIAPIRAAFDGILPASHIRVWHAPGPVSPTDPANKWRRDAAELIREGFLASLQPDVVHITSLFEGFGDDAIHSIGRIGNYAATSVSLYDLIPLIRNETYLKPNPLYEEFYLEKLRYLRKADRYLAISESSRLEIIEHLGAQPRCAVNVSAAADDRFVPIRVPKTEADILLSRFGLVRPFLMYSGATDERKNHLGLIKAFSLLPVELRSQYQLAIVGRLPLENRKRFEDYAATCELKPDDVIVTGGVTDDELVRLYSLCKLFVFPSLHEGFGLPCLEAMRCAAPVVASNTTSLPEVIGRDDALFNPFDEEAMAKKIADVLGDDSFLNELKQHSVEQASQFSWKRTAERAMSAFEKLHAERTSEVAVLVDDADSLPLVNKLINLIAANAGALSEEDLLVSAKSIFQNHSKAKRKQLLVDVSELVRRDAKTGIQRVVRSVICELLADPPRGFEVQLVYASADVMGYRYAHQLTAQLRNREDQIITDEPIEAFQGDVFIGLDLQSHVVSAQAEFYRSLRTIGVSVHFVVYDLLPLLLPKAFPAGAADAHTRWLGTITEADGLMCISRAVADELYDWLRVSGPSRLLPLELGWFHLGADMEQSMPTTGFPANAETTLKALSRRPTFLTVGTVEPRKGHALTLDAFDRLWEAGGDVNLVIVGKHGWNVDSLVEKLRTHPERAKRLFWLQGVSDQYLEEIYARSTCLIAASEGEGFGLPLIEAAQHKLPIIARDIPVFREVAGTDAFYFSGTTANALARSIREWLEIYKVGKHPQSSSMRWLTWKQSTQALLEGVLSGKFYKKWLPDAGRRFWGSDLRLGTEVGERVGLNMIADGRPGYLVFGPYVDLPVGHYVVRVHGKFDRLRDAATQVDVAVDRGRQVLAEVVLAEVEGAFGGKDHLEISLPIFLEAACTDLEIRVRVEGDSDAVISLLEVTPSDARSVELPAPTEKGQSEVSAVRKISLPSPPAEVS